MFTESRENLEKFYKFPDLSGRQTEATLFLVGLMGSVGEGEGV